MDYYLIFHRAKQRALQNNVDIDIFNFIDKTPFEKVHLNFCKYSLGTRKTSSNIGVRSELGRLPIENFIAQQSVLYLSRLYTDNLNPLLKEAFELTKSLDSDGVYSWYTYVKQLVTDEDLKNDVTMCNTSKDLKRIRFKIKNKISDYYQNFIQCKMEQIGESSKLLLYKKLEPSFEREFYLSFNEFSIRRIFTKLRISDHNLEIERGRYNKIPREERLCRTCNAIEDEAHFILKCSKNQNLRKSLFDKILTDYDQFIYLTDDQKIKYLLNPKTLRHVRIIGFFFRQSLELRTEGS